MGAERPVEKGKPESLEGDGHMQRGKAAKRHGTGGGQAKATEKRCNVGSERGGSHGHLQVHWDRRRIQQTYLRLETDGYR